MTDNAKYKQIKRLVNKIILVKEKGDCCNRCKKRFSYNHYDFHHVNPEEKDIEVSKLMDCTIDKIRKEADKCIVVCKVCHYKIHEEMGNNVFTDKEKDLEALIESSLDDFINEKGKVKYKNILKKMQA